MSDSVTFLGTSDGLQSPDRYHASLLLRLGGQTILLDCGEPCSHTLKRMGVNFNSLDAVIVKHTNTDHVGGLPMLLQSLWLEERTRPLPLWLPRHAISPFQEWMHACYLFEPLFRFRIQWRAISAGKASRLGGVRFRAFRTTHLDGVRSKFARKFPRVAFDPFCALFESGGKRIGYSADIGKPSDLAPLSKQPLDLLVVELAHFHPYDLIAFLRERKVKQVAVTHMAREARDRVSEVRALFAERLRSCRVRLVQDGETIRL